MSDTTAQEPKLPEKLSDLIQLALKDLQAIERDSRYVIDMSEWHKHILTEKRCRVCLAGSVMANTLQVDNYLTVFPHDGTFNAKDGWRLLALNCLHLGHISNALYMIGEFIWADILKESNLDRTSVRPYDEDRRGFIEDMDKIADFLKERGL